MDAVVTDPPYGIGYTSSCTTCMDGTPRKNRNSFGDDIYNAEWISEIYRLLREDTPFYCFVRWDVLHKWKKDIEMAGFKVAQRLVWDKAHWKMGDLRYYGSQLEDILFCRKGAPEMQYRKRTGNLRRYSSGYLPEGQYDHPTQKPEMLIQEYIVDSTFKGDTILDPFMGSGTTGVACHLTGRNFIGIEISEEYFKIAEKRIKEAQKQPLLFNDNGRAQEQEIQGVFI